MDTPAVELRDGVFVRRKGFNRYSSSTAAPRWPLTSTSGVGGIPSTYQLARQDVRREEFSVVHTGEGDGWDVTRPCMGSILCARGRLYLIDAGPGIQYTMAALGVSINEIAGIFHTHAHDDHFAGSPPSCAPIIASPIMRRRRCEPAWSRSMGALTGRNEATFYQYFEPMTWPWMNGQRSKGWR